MALRSICLAVSPVVIQRVLVRNCSMASWLWRFNNFAKQQVRTMPPSPFGLIFRRHILGWELLMPRKIDSMPRSPIFNTSLELPRKRILAGLVQAHAPRSLGEPATVWLLPEKQLRSRLRPRPRGRRRRRRKISPATPRLLKRIWPAPISFVTKRRSQKRDRAETFRSFSHRWIESADKRMKRRSR